MKNCIQIYFNKFDELSIDLDKTMIRPINLLLKGAVETLTSIIEQKYFGQIICEKLFLAAANGELV